MSARAHLPQLRPLTADLARQIKARDAILDGEIVCLDAEGRPLFNRLLFRRQMPVSAAFDERPRSA